MGGQLGSMNQDTRIKMENQPETSDWYPATNIKYPEERFRFRDAENRLFKLVGIEKWDRKLHCSAPEALQQKSRLK